MCSLLPLSGQGYELQPDKMTNGFQIFTSSLKKNCPGAAFPEGDHGGLLGPGR